MMRSHRDVTPVLSASQPSRQQDRCHGSRLMKTRIADNPKLSNQRVRVLLTRRADVILGCGGYSRTDLIKTTISAGRSRQNRPARVRSYWLLSRGAINRIRSGLTLLQ